MAFWILVQTVEILGIYLLYLLSIWSALCASNIYIQKSKFDIWRAKSATYASLTKTWLKSLRKLWNFRGESAFPQAFTVRHKRTILAVFTICWIWIPQFSVRLEFWTAWKSLSEKTELNLNVQRERQWLFLHLRFNFIHFILFVFFVF